ncbi:alanine--tRNA ligase [Desulfobaculum bizertense]|uniref:Alanine--tRNA ligase n=1 Tax=Desulfobaculum bizertense DSM 18034 TaxID=1121442 RepID=A0A1T4VCZ2_9BACT|nr:alanine--tRNA ligase [Desulfobaculum bizertense]SKA62766.1 alanyl-tRNA synthetase [Desulfobaculum bizertense DSM 18034]
MLTASDIRKKFLEYFERNGHKPVASSSLIPKDDPSLLFVNAGMVQFKKIYQGLETRDYKRATTSQKCLRVGGKHNDLENVGRTARHHTFFEMLGNFSFGDYFKEDAMRFAWGFITEELKLPKDRLYITIYKDDDEAAELWKKIADIPDDHLYRLGEKDNFWSMGDTGPCGPCSEIHIDQGEHLSCGPNCGIGKCDCDRFLEIWNLVFMQYNQHEDGTRTPLPRPSIDTGMGLERIAAVCQGVFSNFDTDLFQSIIGYISELTGVGYRTDGEDEDTALRVIADHSRAIAFMIADGILPSNEGRGYVLRRLIRRALRFGKLIGMNEPFLYKVALKVVEEMGGHYPELVQNQDFMTRVVHEEEERFAQTLDKGLAMLEDELNALREAGKKTVSGEIAFKLYDTYGFPLDIVNDVAEKQGFEVDEPGFHEFMKEQKARAKAAWKGGKEQSLAARFRTLLEEGLRSEFVGYDSLAADSRIVSLMGEDAEPVEKLSKGEKGFIVSTRTPFYGESGGQCGDTGLISAPEGRAVVNNTIKPAANLTVHDVTVDDGTIYADQEVVLDVNEEQRLAAARNHTVTHLLQAALQSVLGDHVKQAGSHVETDRLRFDFTHISAMTPEELREVEILVNKAIMADLPVNVSEMCYDDAVAKGAMALFGEKYGDDVRVVEVPNTSIELCGGTHLSRTGQAGMFTILSESGIAAGQRRIEAATGWGALEVARQQRAVTEDAAKLLKGKPEEVVERIRGLQKDVKTLRKDIEKISAQAASSKGGDLMDALEEIGGVKVLAAKVAAANMGALRTLMDDVRSKVSSGVAALVCENDGKVSMAIYVSKDLHGRFTAPALIKEVASEVGGSGGGRPDMAQAGGNRPEGIDAALTKLKEIVGA